MERPVIICGLGIVGRRVLDFVLAAGFPVVVIDRHGKSSGPWPDRVRVIQGDFREREVLQAAGIAGAAGVLIVASDERSVITATLAVRQIDPQVRVVVRMFNQNLIPRLGTAVSNVAALSVSGLVAPVIAQTAIHGEALARFSFDGPVNGGRPTSPSLMQQITEITVDSDSPLVGLTIRDAAARHRLVVLSHARGEQPVRRLTDVDPTTPLRVGDQVMVCANPDDLGQLLHDDDERVASRTLIGWVRRATHALERSIQEVDTSMRVCTLILLLVIASGTVTFRYGMETSWFEGIYRTISAIATVADLHGEELAGWQKVFVSALRLTGMAATAAFTAILTNYLVRARLGAALEVRRIPDGGHIVVCGLGNVGYRVVEELVHTGESVVVIETDDKSKFVTTCRRMGVPVVIGDATVTEALRQVRVDRARAVIATTASELTNLEIALLVRELKPSQRVVVRITDPRFAEGLREAADVSMAMSVPDLAAPSFVAALFGDHVRAVLRSGSEMLLVVEVIVQSGEEYLEGGLVGVLAIDHGICPLGVVPVQGQPLIGPCLDHRLQVGDRLFAVATLIGLERLYRREPPPREWSLEITSLPPTAYQTVRTILALHGDAQPQLDALPYALSRRLTKGEATDLARLLRRERVTLRLLCNGESPVTAGQ